MAWYKAGGGGIPSSLKTGMNSVLNKKFGTATTYDPAGWPDDVNLLGKLPEKTASGAIANITDGADRVPVKELIFSASPIQASGTPSPTNPLPIYGHMEMNGAHCGKNLLNPSIAFDNSNYYSYDSATGITTVNASDSRAWTNITEIPIKAGTYCLNNPQGRVQYRLKSESYGTDHNITSSSGTITLSADDGIKIKFGLGTTYPFTASYQLETGNQATTYAPYSAESKKWEFPPFGKNLLNDAGQGTGTIWYYYNDGILLEKDKPYTFSCGNRGSGSISFYGIDHTTQLAYAYIDNSSASVTFTPTEDMRVCPRIYQVGLTPSDVINPQLEQSSTATSYEPYQSMFSGQVNALTGEVESKAKKTTIADLNFYMSQIGTTGIYRLTSSVLNDIIKKTSGSGEVANILCSIYEAKSANATYLKNQGICVATNGYIYIYDDSYNTSTSANDFITAYGSQEVVYELATPISIDMDSVDWQTKLGDNNFYNDCGDTSVTYRQDIDLALGGN